MAALMGVSACTAYGGGETSRQRWEERARARERRLKRKEMIVMEERWAISTRVWRGLCTYGCFRSVKVRASSYYSIIRVNAACAQLPSVRALL